MMERCYLAWWTFTSRMRRRETMSRKRLPRNAPCPCGSGKTYKNCCNGKGFEWEVDNEGGVSKSVPMSEGMVEVLQQLRHAFVDEYGREPEPDDRLFPD